MAGRGVCGIAIICLMTMATTSNSSPVDDEKLNFLSNGENDRPMKKAYTYVSEYKRLPIFNFGIGKRWADMNNMKGAQPYSFGFGKRNDRMMAQSPLNMDMGFVPYRGTDKNDKKDLNNMKNERNGVNEKRGGHVKQYDFGVGKRSVFSILESARGSEKRTGRGVGQYDFGIGKRRESSRNMDNNYEEIEGPRNRIEDDLERRILYGVNDRFADDQVDIQEDD